MAKNSFVNLKPSPTDKIAGTLYRLIVYYLYSFVCVEWAEFYNMTFWAYESNLSIKSMHLNIVTIGHNLASLKVK
jgi:hypothetical protein